MSYEDLVERGLPLARDLVRFDAAFVLEKHPAGFRERAWSDTAPDRQGRALPAQLLRLAEQAERHDATTWSNDLPADDPGAGSWVKSAVVTPVHGPGGTVAVVGVAHHRTWRAVTPRTRRIVEALALHAANVLEHGRVQGEMRRTLEGGMRALSVALDLRDRETAGHTERVVRLAVALGERLGLDEPGLEALRQGAYLHDLGKLTVPDAVLLKPAALSVSELDQMAQHTTRGHAIASQIPGLHPGALDVIRCHHERWDGHGYPEGLAGEDIPLLARIFSVVDVYDALTSERPYKRAWTREEALDELRAGRGRDFDPVILDAFVDVMTTPDLEPELDVETSSV